MVIDNNASVATRFWTLGERAVGALDHIKPLAQLGARWYVASVFFRSGLTKLHDWDITLALFSDEYHVPLLNPTVAAYLATSAELGLSALLVLGLFGRFAAAGLSVLNVVAVISLMDIVTRRYFVLEMCESISRHAATSFRSPPSPIFSHSSMNRSVSFSENAAPIAAG